MGFFAFSAAARPGGNITGLTSISSEMEGKRLELLREVVPKISHIAVLWNAASPIQVIEEGEVRAAAQVLGMKMLSLGVRTQEEIDHALATIVRERPDALLVLADRLFLHHRTRIMDFAAQHRFAGGACIPGIGRGRRSDVLWAKLRGHAQAGRDLCGQDLKGCEAR
jgi:ABC-type uncharacterized transport system substrate-binding protein